MRLFWRYLIAVFLLEAYGASYAMQPDRRHMLHMDLTCAICRDTLLEGTTSVLQCSHTYHTACLVRWAVEHKTCPQDRTAISISQVLRVQKGEHSQNKNAVKCVGCLDYIDQRDFELLPFDLRGNAGRFACGHAYHIACIGAHSQCPAH